MKTKLFALMKGRHLALIALVILAMALAACAAPAAPAADGGEAAEAPAESAEPVTLTFYHWFGGDAGEVVEEIDAMFTEEYPNVTVEFESTTGDTYSQVLNTRLAAGDSPDVFGVYPGTKFHPIAEAGYMTDLSDQPWVDTLLDGAKHVATWEGKVMTMPFDQNVIGVLYNKGIFNDLGLSVPTTWDEFLAVNEAIKEAGIIPMALGIQDSWVDQLIPYAMAPTAIYRDNPDFDQQMYDGEATFVGSGWQQMMEDYLDLESRGYFNDNALGTNYDRANELVATGRAAMLVQGNWALAGVGEKATEELEMGMFPLPYNKDGGDIWVSAAVGGTMTISANTEHPEEAKKYLEFWARPDIMELYLTAKKAFPAEMGVSPDLDPAAAEMLPALEVGSYPFLDQNWPPGVQDVMLADIQSVFAGEMTIEEMLQEMDEAWADSVGE